MSSFPGRVLSTLGLAALVVLSGCAAPGGGESDPESGRDAPAATAEAADDTSSGHALPGIDDCDQIAPIVSAYIAELPLDRETSAIAADSVDCIWASTDETEFEQIQSFSVSIIEGDAEVPDPEAAAELGVDTSMFFTDARLDAAGGVGLWMDAGSEVVGGAVGTVILPGVEVTIADGRWGQDSRLQKEDLVAVAFALLDL